MPRTERARNAGASLVPPPGLAPLLTTLRPPRTALDLVVRHALVATLSGSERILPSLQASLEQTSPFLFVLDDAQLLTDKTGWEILDVMLRAFPPGAQLALGTRTEPPLPLARLQAAGRLLLVDPTALALDAHETAELLALRGFDADEETAAALQAATEGWATGISLAALACHGPPTPAWLAGIRGNQRDIARYHHLFAELLRSELERRDGARLPELHRHAAAWCEDHGQLEEAVRHRLAAGEVAKAAAIVCRAYIAYSSQGQIETIHRWLELFSDEQILSSVPLTLTAGWVASMTGDIRSGRLWSNAALRERIDDSPMPDGTATLRASQATLRAGVGPDGVRRMRQDAELAATLVAESHPAYRAGANTILGVARWLAGDSVAAQTAFQRAVEEGSAFNVIAEIGALGYLALLSADEGRWVEAEAYAEQARQRFTESELGLIGPMLVVPLAEARVLAHRGAPAVEGQVETIATALGRVSVPPWMAVVAAAILAEVALERGDLATVERWTASGMTTLRTWPDAGILRRRLERLRRAVEERRLAGHLTPAERRVLELVATHLPETEIARRLHVSQNTQKTQLRGLFRKLEVHSRSEAVERAREIGLLKN